jgi:hypothetical protein
MNFKHIIKLILCLTVFLSPIPVFGAELIGRYQLIPAQYEDKNGNVHPIVYRIDTQTGMTHAIEYTVQTIGTNSVRFRYFNEVYESEEFLRQVKLMKDTFK